MSEIMDFLKNHYAIFAKIANIKYINFTECYYIYLAGSNLEKKHGAYNILLLHSFTRSMKHTYTIYL